MHQHRSGMSDTDIRVKRLKIRSWRRGTKEMDLFFGHYADAYLPTMTEVELNAFEALLAEEDPIITNWVMGNSEMPEMHSDLIKKMINHLKSVQI